jgi:hypothetical protein
MSGLELKQRVEAIRQKVEERGLGEVLGRVSPGEVASVGPTSGGSSSTWISTRTSGLGRG